MWPLRKTRAASATLSVGAFLQYLLLQCMSAFPGIPAIFTVIFLPGKGSANALADSSEA